MQSSDNASEPNHSQPQAEPMYPTPQEGQSSQSQQADEPIFQQESQQPQSLPIQAEEQPVIDQDQHKFDNFSEPYHPQPQGPQKFHLPNYPQPLSAIVYEPSENYPPSQIQQNFDQVSEPNNLQPAEPMDSRPSNFQFQQAYEPIIQPGLQQFHPSNYPQPLSAIVYQPPANEPLSQEEHKFDQVSEPYHPQPQGPHKFHLPNYPQPLNTLVYQPPANELPSQEEHKFDHVSEPNHSQLITPEPQEGQSSQSQQAYEPIIQPGLQQFHPSNYPQPLSALVYQPPADDPSFQDQQKFDQVSESNHSQLEPQEAQSSKSQQAYEPGSQQPHLHYYQQPLPNQAYQPPAGYPHPIDQHKFDSNPQHQAVSMDLKPQEGQSQSALDLILHQGSNPQNYQPPFPNQEYQPPAGSPYSQEQLDYAVYNLEVEQGRNTALKQLMLEHISKRIKAPGQGFVILYFIIIILGSLALAFIFPDDNDYQIMLSAYRRISLSDYQISDTFMNPGSCQAFLGVTLSIPLFLVIFFLFNFFDFFASCLGITWGMYPQFFVAGIWTAIAAYTSQQQCKDQSTLASMFGGVDKIPENPWFYLAGMAFVSLGTGLLNYLFSSNKESAEKNKKELALVLSAY